MPLSRDETALALIDRAIELIKANNPERPQSRTDKEKVDEFNRLFDAVVKAYEGCLKDHP